MKQRGFTIVEIIIVLIVLGILATIGGLAWHKAQANAMDSKVKSDIAIITDAIEQYYQDNGQYPFPVTGSCAGYSNWRHCRNGEIASILVPRYLKEVPKNSNGKHYEYHTDKVPARYGLKADMSSGKCITGKDIHANWRSDGYTRDCSL